jgi:hypothetical protein
LKDNPNNPFSIMDTRVSAIIFTSRYWQETDYADKMSTFVSVALVFGIWNWPAVDSREVVAPCGA